MAGEFRIPRDSASSLDVYLALGVLATGDSARLFSARRSLGIPRRSSAPSQISAAHATILCLRVRGSASPENPFEYWHTRETETPFPLQPLESSRFLQRPILNISRLARRAEHDRQPRRLSTFIIIDCLECHASPAQRPSITRRVAS